MPSRVLVVDDSSVTLELITGALAAAGIGADSAADLASLDLRLRSGGYDVLLVDVNMPEMFGDDVVEFLRSQRRLATRLYLYSDLAEAELAQKAEACGADGFITKSSGLEAAVRLVRSALPAQWGRRRVLVVAPDAPRLADALAHHPLEVLTATSSDEATKLILDKRTRPDLVLVDPRLAGATTLLHFLKANSLFAAIRVATLATAPALPGADAHLADDAALGAGLLALLEDVDGAPCPLESPAVGKPDTT